MRLIKLLFFLYIIYAIISLLGTLNSKPPIKKIVPQVIESETTLQEQKETALEHFQRRMNELGKYQNEESSRGLSQNKVVQVSPDKTISRTENSLASSESLIVEYKKDGQTLDRKIEKKGERSSVTYSQQQILDYAQSIGANEIELIHNHPRGHLRPSQEDLVVKNKDRKLFDYYNINTKFYINTSQGEIEY